MSMKNSVKISIAMGVYNPADKKRFYRAVRSVIGQTFTDWELLLYDDGSEPEFAAVITGAAKLDARIRCIRGNRNRGLAYALNECIRQAKGEFVARMDEDDWCHKERLACQAAFLDTHAKFAWVGSNAELVDEQGVWGYQRMPEFPKKKDFLFNSPYIHPTVMFRKKALEEVGGYCTNTKIRQCEDYELFMRLQAQGYRGYNIQKALLQYREDYESVKKRTYARRIREMKVRQKGFQELNLLNSRTFGYVVKPLLVGAVPAPVHHYIKRTGKQRRQDRYTACYQKRTAFYDTMKRLELPAGENPVSRAALSVLAPSLAGFVEWVLAEAIRTRKQRLYFLARDGYLMYCAALLYCREYHLPLECRYLRCSRYSLRIPMYHRDHAQALEYICRGGIAVTPDKIFSRAGLSKEEGQDLKKKLHLPYYTGQVIPYAALSEMKEKLAESKEFLKRMDAHSKRALPMLEAYLRQEGLTDGRNEAIVDSGWTGSMQKTLNEVLSGMGRTRKLEGYYWGLYELPPDAEKSQYHCYDFSPEHHLRAKVHFNNNLFEAVFSAPHGMTLGYKRQDGRIVPVCAELSKEQKQFQIQMERLMMEYLRELIKQKKRRYRGFLQMCEPKEQAVQLQTIRRLLCLFMTQPTVSEAGIFGSLPFSDDVLEGRERPLAERLTQKELRQNHVFARIMELYGGKAPARESAWYEGSAVLGRKQVKWHLQQYSFYKYLCYRRKEWKNRKQKKEGKGHA